MLLIHQKYNLEVVYKPGTQMYVRDHLSRACSGKQGVFEEENEEEVQEFERLNV